MAAYNRFENYMLSQFNLPKVDLGILARTLDAKQKRFDVAYDLGQDIDAKMIDALPQHQKRALEIQQDWQNKKEKIVEGYNGDYSASYRDIKKLGEEIQKAMSPGGEANAIATQKQLISDWYQTAAKDKEVNPEALNLGWNYYMDPNSAGYIGDIQKDALTGSYKLTTPEQLAKWVNPDTIVLPAIKQLEAEGYETEQDNVTGQWIVRDKVSGERLSPERIMRTAYRALANDSNYVNSLNQAAKFRNASNFNSDDYLQGLAASYAQDFAYDKTKTSRTLDENQWAMHYDREARKDARQNKILESMSSAFDPDKTYLDYGSNMLGKPISPADLANAKDTYSDIPGIATLGPTAVMAQQLYNMTAGPIKSTMKKGALYYNEEWGKDFVSKSLENGSFERIGGNTTLMRHIINNTPDNATGADLLKKYNEALLQVGGALKPAAKQFNLKTGQTIAKEMLLGSAGQFTTIRVQKENGKVTPITYNEFIKTYGKEIYNENGTLNPNFSVLQNMVDASAGVNPSFVFKANGGKDVVYMEAPPAYTAAMRPITELAQAYHNSSGESTTYGIPNFVLPMVDPITKQVIPKDYSNIPLKMKVTFESVNGVTMPIKKLYEQVQNPGSPESEWVESPLSLDLIEQTVDEVAFPKSFGTRHDKKDYSTMRTPFGDEVLIDE